MRTLPNPSLFRAYDVRGIVGETLHATDMRAIGQALASEAIDRVQHTSPTIVLCRDGRLSSPALAEALRDGLMMAGATVIDIGMGPSPYAYFAAKHLNADGCAMITGSHNPKHHNGMKAVIAGHTLHGDELLQLRNRLADVRLYEGDGRTQTRDLRSEYAATLLHEIPAFPLGFSIAWDSGNGAAGEMVTQLAARINASQHKLLYCNVDGHFPNHHPDPSDVKNLTDLQAVIAQHETMIGLAFDGDGDRLGVLDEKGRPLAPDHLLMLLSRDVLAARPGASIIADVKTSDRVFDDIAAHGGTPIMGKTGHALIKEAMRDTGALFAGEASGHLFFADRYYGFDDGLYAAMRVIALIAKSGMRLYELVDALPTLHVSPEWRIDCADDTKFGVIEALAAALAARGASVNTLDGVRVSAPDGWWLIRASNTQAALVARAEGHDEAALVRIRGELEETLAGFGLQLP